MSKLGKKPILIPKEAKVKVESGKLILTGPKGSRELNINDKIFSTSISDENNLVIKLLNKKGVINVGGNAKTVYNFAKKFNPSVKKIYVTKNSMYKFPLKPFMNISKLKKIIN